MRLQDSPEPANRQSQKIAVATATALLSLSLASYYFQSPLLRLPGKYRHTPSGHDDLFTKLSKDRPLFIKPPNWMDKTIGDCPVAIQLVSDNSVADVWPVPIFWATTDRQGAPWQTTMLFNTEPPVHHKVPTLSAAEKESGRPHPFDLTMSWDLDSDVPHTYDYINREPELRQLRKPPMPFEEKLKVPISAFIGNCDETAYPRSDMLQKFIDLMPGQIHSYGKCHRNREENDDLTAEELSVIGPDDEGAWWRRKNVLVRKHKFHLAFENSRVVDYVTEKYFGSLIEGTIPIYIGAPNLRDQFMPNAKSAIIVDEFNSLEEVVALINYLSENEEAYNEYLDWKNHPFDEAFQNLYDFVSEYSPLCKLAMLMKGMWKNEFKRPRAVSSYL